MSLRLCGLLAKALSSDAATSVLFWLNILRAGGMIFSCRGLYQPRETAMEPIEKLSISMPGEMMRPIREGVETGEFASTSEAICEAVRVWQHQRKEDAERLHVLRTRIRRSLDDPRANLSLAEIDAQLAALFARAERAGGYAAP
jgi:antitoxin ParD1/3/4